MESVNSTSHDQDQMNTPPKKEEQWFSDHFESVLPQIQERWPDMAKQTLEATRGSLDELVRVISLHSGKTTYGVKEQLEELFNTASNRTKNLAENLEPLEKQLEDLYRLREIYMRSSMWIRDVKLDGEDICPNRNRKYKNRNGNSTAGSGK